MKSLTFFLLLVSPSFADDNVVQYLQEISATVKSGSSSGSGVFITKEVDGRKTNFVLTAGHVIDGLRSTREIVDKNGQKKTLIEFKDAEIVKELIEEGRTVGQMSFEAKVIKYSDSEDGDDLAVLLVRKRGLVDKSVKFYSKEEIVPVGTKLYHVGSRFGMIGANSMTFGMVSQIGRVLPHGNSSGAVYDLVNVSALPGSSGGGIFLSDGENIGEYVGMLTRGGDSSFNFMSPIRRIREYMKENNIEWLINDDIAPPLKEILSLPIENSTLFSTKEQPKDINYHTLILLE